MRWPATEIMISTDAVRALVRKGDDHQLRSQISVGRADGMMTMESSGGSRKTFDVYASCIGQSLEPDRVGESAAQLKKEGYKSQKWFPTRMPSDGQLGYEENVALIRILRETVGENYDIMIDALLRWNLPYAMKWCKDAEQYRPRWLEEPVPTAGQVESLARLRQMTFIPIATLYYFDKNQLIPKNSQITLPDLPGLGIELDESKIVKRERIYPEA